MNHKLLIPLVLLACTLSSLHAQETTPSPLAPLESGRLLFIEASEDVTITLDGKMLGTAPLMVNLDKRQTAELRFDSVSASSTQDIRVNPAITGITTLVPRLKTLEASLNVVPAPSDSTILLVDGAATELKSGKADGISAGTHEITIMTPGMASLRVNMYLGARAENSLSYAPVPGFALDFGPEINPDCLVTVMGTEGSPGFSWHVSEKFLLPEGKTTLRINDPVRFRTWDLEGDPKELSASTIILDARSGTASLVFRTDSPGTAITANQVALGTTANGTFTLPGGLTAITVTDGGKVVGSDIVMLQPNGQVDGSIIREPYILPGSGSQPQASIQKDASAFWILLISGAAVLGTSLVMNLDDVMIAITPDYDSYTVGKYVTMGSTGLGIALMASSLFF